MYEINLTPDVFLAERVEKKSTGEFINPADQRGDSSVLRIAYCRPDAEFKKGDLVLVDPIEYGQVEFNAKQYYVIRTENILGGVFEGNKK